MVVESNNISLGGNIELVGFKEMDGGSMIILKKMVGNHVRKLSGMCDNFENLTLTMKKVGAGNNKFEMNARLLDNGKQFNTEVTDFNLFFTTDKVLQKMHNVIKT